MLTYTFIDIYIDTHIDMQKQCIKELKTNIVQLQSSNSESRWDHWQREVLSQWCLQANPARKTDQGTRGEQEHNLDEPRSAHISSSNFIPVSHEQRALRRDLCMLSKFWGMWLPQVVWWSPGCVWQLWPTPLEKKLILASQHHARDDKKMKLSL